MCQSVTYLYCEIFIMYMNVIMIAYYFTETVSAEDGAIIM